MLEPGPKFRKAFTWLPSYLASQSDSPVGAARRFGSTEHLSTEAVAAFVDGELQMRAHLRAAHHLSICRQCSAEIDAQRQARDALRDSRPVSMPSNLMGLLTQIPSSAPDETPAMPPSLADQVTDGTVRDRRKRR
ncbi:MAG: anti-sigma E factor RseA [Mycobacterium sp.]